MGDFLYTSHITYTAVNLTSEYIFIFFFLSIMPEFLFHFEKFPLEFLSTERVSEALMVI